MGQWEEELVLLSACLQVQGCAHPAEAEKCQLLRASWGNWAEASHSPSACCLSAPTLDSLLSSGFS